MNTEESGITLVELLAVLSLLSVVILLGGSVHMFGQRQFQAQTESASQNNDLSYAMTVMSTDIRKVPLNDVEERLSVNDTDYLMKIKSESEGTITYIYSEDELRRNGQRLVNQKPTITLSEDNSKLEITFEQNNNIAGISDKDYRTTIYFRGEPEN